MILQCFFQGDDCGGPIRWHHPVTRQRLRREFKYGAWRHPGETMWHPIQRGVHDWSAAEIELLSLDAILGDIRNRVFLCDTHHERLHNHRFYLELPESVWDFARSFGLDAALENDMRKAA